MDDCLRVPGKQLDLYKCKSISNIWILNICEIDSQMNIFWTQIQNVLRLTMSDIIKYVLKIKYFLRIKFLLSHEIVCSLLSSGSD